MEDAVSSEGLKELCVGVLKDERRRRRRRRREGVKTVVLT